MRIADAVEQKRMSAAGMVCVAASLMLAALPCVAQEQRTGVSHPPTTPITADPGDDINALPPAKPSAAIPLPMTAPTQAPTTTTAPGGVIPASSGEVYGAYVPYNGGSAAAASSATSTGPAFDPDANIVTAATAGQSDRRQLSADANAKGDPDAGIVTRVPSPQGAIGEGTLVKAQLRETISSETTQPGTNFSAVVSEPVLREGQVIVPAGSVLEGRVTYVHSGTRFNGGAAIHLEPRAITLPDGSTYVVRARVIDTGDWDKTKVDDEGTIVHRGSAKKTAATFGLATGGGLAAGALIGGAPGAVIGAGVGAGAATVVWLKQDTQAELPKSLGLVFSLTEPMSTTPMNAPDHAAAAVIEKTGSGGE